MDINDISDPIAAPVESAAPPEIDQHVNAIISQESGGDPNAVGDAGLAVGLGQMHPEVRRAYNLRPDSTPDEQKAAVKSYFTDLWNKHKGNADDAVSEYHLGIPNFEKDRNSPANLAYLDTHKKKMGAATAPTAGTVSIDDISSPSATLEPDAETAVTTTPTSTPEQATAQATGTEIPSSPTATPAPQKSLRSLSVEEAGDEINRSFGNPEGHWTGRYTAALGKPSVDALQDLYDAVVNAPKDTKMSMEDGIKYAMEGLHPLAVPAEIVGEVVLQAGQDAGMDPTATAVVSTLASLLAGAKTPLPGGIGAAKAPAKALTPSRAIATEAEALASRAAATEAAGIAETAAAKTAPSVAAGERAAAELAPAGVSVEQGGQAAVAGLEKSLADVKAPVKGIYNAVAEKHADKVLADPQVRQTVVDGIDVLKEELGQTYSGQSKAVLDELQEKLLTGDPLTYADLEIYKNQLDSLLPGRLESGATPRVAALYKQKWEVRDAMRTLVDGDDKEWLAAADNLYRNEIIGKDNPLAIGNLVRLAKKSPPEVVVERLLGEGKKDQQAAIAKAVLKHLDADKSGAGEAVRQALFTRLLKPTAEGAIDPAKLLDSYDKMTPEFRKAISNPGAETFFDVLRQEQTAATKGAEWAKAATATAKEAEKAATKAGKPSKVKPGQPSRAAYLTANGLEIAAGAMAGKAVGHPIIGIAAAHYLIPTKELALLLTNSKAAMLLARAMKTPTNSAVVPAIIQQLKKHGAITEKKEKE